MNFFHSIHFRPVGQGLFVHGNLRSKDDSIRFEWVYDCGASDLAARLIPQIDVYAAQNPREIDLLIVSHFHADHVEGIEQLVAKRQPRIIVAPYLTLWERLYLISRLEPGETDYANVLLQPAAWLRSIAPNARIIFIAPANPNDGGELVPDGVPDRPPESSDRSVPDWPGRDAIAADGEDQDIANSNVVVARTRAPLLIEGYWEFAFYNKPRPEMAKKFKSLARTVLDTFYKSRKSPRDYVDLIDDLQSIFGSIRGPSSQRFLPNEISLVTYSGPRDRQNAFVDVQPWLIPVGLSPADTRIGPDHWPPPFSTTEAPCGLLLTGDITFDAVLLSDIEDRFTSSRLQYVRYFQVPHHGSKHSFLLAPTTTFRPQFPVFSSDRYHAKYDHPSSKVVSLFRHANCFFTNEFQGVVVGGHTS